MKRSFFSLGVMMFALTLAIATDGGTYKPDTGGTYDEDDCVSIVSGNWLATTHPTLGDGCSGSMELYIGCGEPKADGILPCWFDGDADGAAEMLAICLENATDPENECWSMDELLSGGRPMYCEPDLLGDYDCTMYSGSTMSTVLATVELDPSSFNDDEMDVNVESESSTYTPTYGSQCPSISWNNTLTFYRQDSSHDSAGAITSAESVFSSLDDCEVIEEEPEDTGLNPEEAMEDEAKEDLTRLMNKYNSLCNQEPMERKISYLELFKQTMEKWGWILPEEDRQKRFHQGVILISLVIKDPVFATDIENLINEYLDGEIDDQIFVQRVLHKLWKKRPEDAPQN